MENYVVSARKYRPRFFKDVVGQVPVITTLQNALKANQLAHAFLFCGPRGVGKTTCARILAKSINCQQPGAAAEPCDQCVACTSFNTQTSFNIYELDAASNNSVEDIRSLVEQVRYPPQQGRYKVYIIDEVHMLSQAAFNAFLKTLEEPPSYAIFILATTEKHKILPTILSRCQLFDFQRVTPMHIVSQLRHVAEQEAIPYEEEALHLIGQKADGALRDALSIFDVVISLGGGKLTYQAAIENLHILDYDYYFKLTAAFKACDISKILLVYEEIMQRGFDGQYFLEGLLAHLRNLLVAQEPTTVPLLAASLNIQEKYRLQAVALSPTLLIAWLRLTNLCAVQYKESMNKRLHVELALIELASQTQDDQLMPAMAADVPMQLISPLPRAITYPSTLIKSSGNLTFSSQKIVEASPSSLPSSVDTIVAEAPSLQAVSYLSKQVVATKTATNKPKSPASSLEETIEEIPGSLLLSISTRGGDKKLTSSSQEIVEASSSSMPLLIDTTAAEVSPLQVANRLSKQIIAAETITNIPENSIPSLQEAVEGISSSLSLSISIGRAKELSSSSKKVTEVSLHSLPSSVDTVIAGTSSLQTTGYPSKQIVAAETVANTPESPTSSLEETIEAIAGSLPPVPVKRSKELSSSSKKVTEVSLHSLPSSIDTVIAGTSSLQTTGYPSKQIVAAETVANTPESSTSSLEETIEAIAGSLPPVPVKRSKELSSSSKKVTEVSLHSLPSSIDTVIAGTSSLQTTGYPSKQIVAAETVANTPESPTSSLEETIEAIAGSLPSVPAKRSKKLASSSKKVTEVSLHSLPSSIDTVIARTSPLQTASHLSKQIVAAETVTNTPESPTSSLQETIEVIPSSLPSSTHTAVAGEPSAIIDPLLSTATHAIAPTNESENLLFSSQKLAISSSNNLLQPGTEAIAPLTAGKLRRTAKIPQLADLKAGLVAPHPTPTTSIPIQQPAASLAYEQVMAYWQTYAQQCKAVNKMPAYNLLQKPFELTAYTISIAFTNAMEEHILADIKESLVEYLRKSLKNHEIVIKGVLVIPHEKETIKPYTAQERFRYLAHKNSSFILLKNQLQLEVLD